MLIKNKMIECVVVLNHDSKSNTVKRFGEFKAKNLNAAVEQAKKDWGVDGHYYGIDTTTGNRHWS